MRRLILICLGVFCGYAYSAMPTDSQTWKGELYGITPAREGITVEYCKAHAFDTFQAPANMVDKDITADNGVKAKDLGYTTKQIGSLYFREGTAEFNGIIDGKAWQQKVHYYSQSLSAKNSMRQGAWYSKDCKGFYKVTPL